jgi:hypothetical protein
MVLLLNNLRGFWRSKIVLARIMGSLLQRRDTEFALLDGIDFFKIVGWINDMADSRLKITFSNLIGVLY